MPEVHKERAPLFGRDALIAQAYPGMDLLCLKIRMGEFPNNFNASLNMTCAACRELITALTRAVEVAEAALKEPTDA